MIKYYSEYYPTAQITETSCLFTHLHTHTHTHTYIHTHTHTFKHWWQRLPCNRRNTVLSKRPIIFLCSAINTFSGTDIGLREKSGVKCLAQGVLGQSWDWMMTLQLVDNQLYLLSNRQPIEWQQRFSLQLFLNQLFTQVTQQFVGRYTT